MRLDYLIQDGYYKILFAAVTSHCKGGWFYLMKTLNAKQATPLTIWRISRLCLPSQRASHVKTSSPSCCDPNDDTADTFLGQMIGGRVAPGGAKNRLGTCGPHIVAGGGRGLALPSLILEDATGVSALPNAGACEDGPSASSL